MITLFKNIKELLQVRPSQMQFVAGADMNDLPTIKDAFLLVKDGLISDFGPMSECPSFSADKEVDASGCLLLPSWCDSHTHLVYTGTRENEFVDRINGFSYAEIAGKGGGILNSAEKLQLVSEDALYTESSLRLDELIQLGTGAIEIKSGYGLTLDAECKMLRVIKRLKENYSIPIKATFLAAHALPKNFKDNKEGYVQYIIDEMLPVVAKEQLANFIDVFCEKDYFSVEDTERILELGARFGLQGKVHVNQFSALGGVEVCVSKAALSVDHLEEMREEDIKVLKETKTMPVALPGCSFFLGIPYAPARKMIDDGLALALASDYNPGSAPSGNMNFVVSTACIKMNMTPEEAINAATLNGAYAMGLATKVGSITKGKMANLILTKPISSYRFIPYSFGQNQIDKVYLKGEEV